MLAADLGSMRLMQYAQVCRYVALSLILHTQRYSDWKDAASDADALRTSLVTVTKADAEGRERRICGRYVVYHDWVQTVVPVGGRVFVSDVRDVFFQSNPFDSPQPDAAATLATSTGAQLLVFEETRGSRAHVRAHSPPRSEPAALGGVKTPQHRVSRLSLLLG